MARHPRRGACALVLTGAVIASALPIGTTLAADKVPGPELEYVWETGTAGTVYDGDTLDVRIGTSSSGISGTKRVRTIGVNAPEITRPAQCGAARAKAALKALMPPGTRLQLRAIQPTSRDQHSGGRIGRSIYALDDEGNWFDTARQLVSDGSLLWFPLSATSSLKPEWAHNLEYRVLAEDAAAARRGLWSPNLCGSSPAPGARLRMWLDYDGRERVWIANDGDTALPIGGWTLRDSALNTYDFPAAARIPAHGYVRLQMSAGKNDLSRGLFYLGRTDNWFNNLPDPNPGFMGDAAYLMDNAGKFSTGNLRAVFAYPCNPDNCDDAVNNPLRGKVKITAIRPDDPARHGPSKPQAVTAAAATALTDGGGAVTVTWKAPADLGGPRSEIQYQVAGRAGDGSESMHPDTSNALTRTFQGLRPGAAYTFRVTAINPHGSAASSSTPPVEPTAAPGAPQLSGVTAGQTSLVVSWEPPTSDGGARITGYQAIATPVAGGTPVTVTTAGPIRSAALTGLAPATGYSVAIRALNPAAGAAATVLASTQPLAPAAPTGAPALIGPALRTPGQPSVPTVTAHSATELVVSWPAPADGGAPVTSYVVRHSTGSGLPAGTVACVTGSAATPPSEPLRSCLVAGLTAGTPQRFTVAAVNAVGAGPASGPSASVRPAAYPAGPGGPTAATPDDPVDEPWQANEEVVLTNVSSGPVILDGHALYDQEARDGKFDSADAILPPGTTIPAGGSLRVLTGSGRAVPAGVAGKAARVFTGASNFLSETADRVELAGLNRALVNCSAYGGVSCAGQRPMTTPTPPVGVTARTNPTTVAIHWGAPISRGGTAITGYVATAFDAPQAGRVIGTCRANAAGRSCGFPGSIGTRYFVEVVAHNAVGASVPSAPRTLAAPRTVPSAPGHVSVARVTGGISVAWQPAAPNGATITSYTASAHATATGGKRLGSCTTTGAAVQGRGGACTITGLTAGRYFVDVIATNRAGNGSASSPRLSAVVGDSQTAPTVRAQSTVSKRRVTVRWDAPPAGTLVRSYVARVFSKASGGKVLGTCTATAGAQSCRTGKLRKQPRYYIELTAQLAVGASTTKPRIVTGPARKASAPRISRVTASGRNVTTAWLPPSFNGYSYLSGYRVRLHAKAKGGSVLGTCSAAVSQSRCVASVARGSSAYAAVQVQNSKGWSKWSKRVRVALVR